MAGSQHFDGLFRGRLEASPEGRALASPGRGISWSFAQLDEAVEGLSAFLRSQGLGPKARIGLSFANRPEFVVSLLAISRVGGICVPLDPGLTREEAEVILADSGASGVLSASAESFQDLEPVAFEDIFFAPRQGHDAPESLAEVEILKYTSGTTGIPKGVMLTAAHMAQEGINVVETLGLTSDDLSLAAVPLFHSYGFDFCVMPLLTAGTPLVLAERFLARSVLKTLEQEKITLFPAIPFMLDLLTRVDAEAPGLDALRYCISAAAPLSARTVRRFHEKFGVVICQNFGSSEAGAITLEIRKKPDLPSTCLGKALAHVSLEIVDDELQPLRHGEIGQVSVGGGQVALGYYNDPQLTREYFVDGRCLTGDRGYLDEAGNLYLSGRTKHFINVGGKKVSPREVELVLEQHPKLEEVAVVGADDEAMGEIVKACYVSREAIEAQELIAHCAQHLAAYKIPQRWEAWDELPRNSVGKLLREKLKG